MAKKLILSLAAIAVVAACIPSVAGASKITNGSGGETPAGTLITATSIDTSIETEFGNIACGSVAMPLKLINNHLGLVQASSEGVGVPKECKLNGKSISLTNLEWTSLTAVETGKGTFDLTLKIDFPLITCHYEPVEEAPVKFTYKSGSSSLFFAVEMVETPPSEAELCGFIHFEGDYFLSETKTGKSLIFD